MTVKRPNLTQLRAVAEDLGMNMSNEDLESYLSLLEGNFAAYDLVEAMPDYLPEVKYPRTPGYRPEGEENKYNAWYVKTTIKGAPSGKLAGKTIAIKDNVCVAGVPMMNGASTLEGYTPDLDATIVTRILDAGGTIVGKTHCEYFCFSGGSHTNATGPVHNPHRMGYSAGGSSSGSGVVVATGEADMAIGGDQGGSIRMPAAFCGIYGMKGTHGLVPYTGVMPIEITLDHTGPMTNNVRDNALLLEVLAGADGLDPRQYAPKVAEYTKALDGGVKGLKIGVVKEGFGLPNSEAGVDAKVNAASKVLAKLGATVEEISVPMHLLGTAIWLPIAAEGATELMMKGNGMGTNWRGLYTTSLLDAHSAWKHRADELSDSLKITMLLGQYFTKHYRGHFYAKAQCSCRCRAPPGVGSEGPPGGAAWLPGRDGIGVLGSELVDIPRRRSGAGGAVLVGEATVGHGRCPATPGEHLGEALKLRIVGDTDGPALELHVVAVNGDAEGDRGSRSTLRILRDRGPPQK